MWKKNIVALYVGRLVLEKNLDVLIKASRILERRIPNIHFVIVGGGPAADYYKRLTTRYNVGHLFSFIGAVDPKQVLKYYHNADVFVFPSVFETQGLSGIEAMACGLPVAGARYLAIPDVVKHGLNGYLFDPHSVRKCAKAIMLTIKNKEKLSINAIKTARRYSVTKCTKRLYEMYKTVCKTVV